jgi:hypothetical protein
VGGFGAAAAYLDPGRDCFRVGAGQAAQPRGPAGERLIQLALMRALKDAGDLGEQVTTSGRELGQLGYCGGFLVCGQVAPFGAVAGGAGEPGNKNAVGVRSETILGHSDRIEHSNVKSI